MIAIARCLIVFICLAGVPQLVQAASLTATPVTQDCGDPTYLTDAQGTLFFAASAYSRSAVLCASDGTKSGTRVLSISNTTGDSLLNDGRHPIVPVGGRVFFTASDGTSTGLWTSDGTNFGTRMVSPSCTMECGIGYCGAVIFSNDRDGTLWTSTSAVDSAVQLNATATKPSDFTVGPDGALYFLAGSPARHLWTSDGTASGTRCVSETLLISGLGHPLTAYVHTGAAALVVVAAAGPTAPYLVYARSTRDGPLTAIPQPQWAPGTIPAVLGSGAAGICFTGDVGSHGAVLWSSDVSHAATRIIDVDPAAHYSATRFSQAIPFAGALAIATDTGLWLTDLTTAGTRLVASLRIDVRRGLDTAYGLLIFSTGDRLITSDGTPAGTLAVTGGDYDLLRSHPGSFCVSGSSVFLTGDVKVSTGHALNAIHGRGPQIALAAVASTLQNFDSSVELRMAASDADVGAELRYTWTTDGLMVFTGATNGTAESRHITAEFQAAGNYAISCTIADQWGVSVSSAMTVTVPQRMCGLTLTAPPTNQNVHQQFTATGRDQFDQPMVPPGPIHWMVSGGGSITDSGLFTAEPAAETSLTLTATCGTFTRKAQVIVRTAQIIVICGPELTVNFQSVPYTITVSGRVGRVPLVLGDHALFSSGQTTLIQNPGTIASYIVIRPANAGAFSFDIGDPIP